jgi:hypothetical protein
LKPCDACAAGEAKQKNVPQVSKHLGAKVNKARMFHDIATVKSLKDGPKVTKSNWRVLVDKRTQINFLDFFDTKNGMVESTCK